jgi:hypothetical protein
MLEGDIESPLPGMGRYLDILHLFRSIKCFQIYHRNSAENSSLTELDLSGNKVNCFFTRDEFMIPKKPFCGKRSAILEQLRWRKHYHVIDIPF